MIKAGIIGVSGYSGAEVLELLLNHKDVRVQYVSANNTTGKITDIWPRLKGTTTLNCTKFNITKAINSCDVLFLAVPHTISMEITPKLIEAGKKVIDLSGDYRFNSAQKYKQWYKKEHKDAKNLKKAIYGLPELYRESIKKAALIANPGCYPTAAILALAPFVSIFPDVIDSIIIDAKSGMTGAGKKAAVPFIFSELNENFKAYKVLNHQHAPEIDLYLSKVSAKKIGVDFVPHLLPINRGILETIYVRLNDKIVLSNLHKIYKRFYKTEHFVRILDLKTQPEIKNVTNTNYCDIALDSRKDGKLLVITSVIDNLVKGAAGQAIQNMNIMCGFDEKEGLK